MRASLSWAPILLLGGCLPFMGHGNPDGGDDVVVDLGATGTFGDLWQRAATDLSVFDQITGSYKTKTVAGAEPVPWPEDGEPLESFLSIVDDQLVTQVWQQGEPVYHTLRQPLLVIDEENFMLAGTDSSRSFSLMDGHLYEVSQTQFGDTIVLTETTYGAYQGAFPPKKWPTQALEADLPEVQP